MALLGGSVQRVSDRFYLLNSKTNISIPPQAQVQRENHLGFHTNGLTTGAIHHHAVVLVNPRNTIVDETSLVELKTDESNCCEFPVRRGKVGHADLPAEDRHMLWMINNTDMLQQIQQVRVSISSSAFRSSTCGT